MTILFQAKFLVMIIISFPLFSLANHHGNINTNWKDTELIETYNCNTLKNLKQDELLKMKKLRLSEKEFYNTVIVDLNNTIKTGSGQCGFNPEHDNKINRIISVAKSKCETQNISKVDLGLKYHAVYKCISKQNGEEADIAYDKKKKAQPRELSFLKGNYNDAHYEARKLCNEEPKFTGVIKQHIGKETIYNFHCSSPKESYAEKERKQKQAIKKLESEKITLGMGSGFWFNSQGYFATNHHVIEGCKTTQVKVDNELVNSNIISFDKINDLAIGKVDKNIKSFFSLSDKPELGEDVMVGGFPLSGVLQNDSIKITRGIVSSLSGFNNNYSMLQIDAPIQKGNSGGPIINTNGEVVGVVTSYLKSTEEYEAQNVNFGVKVNLLRNMAQSLGIDLMSQDKQKSKNSKQLAKTLEKNTVHIHCTNTLKQWVEYQTNQDTNVKLSEHIKLNLKDYMK